MCKYAQKNIFFCNPALRAVFTYHPKGNVTLIQYYNKHFKMKKRTKVEKNYQRQGLRKPPTPKVSRDLKASAKPLSIDTK